MDVPSVKYLFIKAVQAEKYGFEECFFMNRKDEYLEKALEVARQK